MCSGCWTVRNRRSMAPVPAVRLRSANDQVHGKQQEGRRTAPFLLLRDEMPGRFGSCGALLCRDARCRGISRSVSSIWEAAGGGRSGIWHLGGQRSRGDGSSLDHRSLRTVCFVSSVLAMTGGWWCGILCPGRGLWVSFHGPRLHLIEW